MNRQDIIAGRCEILQQDLARLPFNDHYFDLITAYETIYFWPNIESTFAEIHRNLKTGSVFLICNESGDSYSKNIKKWADMLQFHVYTPQELNSLLQPLDFNTSFTIRKNGNMLFLATKNEKTLKSD